MHLSQNYKQYATASQVTANVFLVWRTKKHMFNRNGKTHNTCKPNAVDVYSIFTQTYNYMLMCCVLYTHLYVSLRLF